MTKDDASLQVPIKIESGGEEPLYATEGSAGCDLFLASPMVLLPGEKKVLPLRFRMALPQGVEAQIRPRSGLSLKTSLRLGNSPGTIDSDYRDLVGVVAENTASPDPGMQILQNPDLLQTLQETHREVRLADLFSRQGQDPSELPASLGERRIWVDENDHPWGTLYLEAGQRVAQMVFCRYLKAHFVSHDDPAALGRDRGGGFGSTGQ